MRVKALHGFAAGMLTFNLVLQIAVSFWPGSSASWYIESYDLNLQATVFSLLIVCFSAFRLRVTRRESEARLHAASKSSHYDSLTAALTRSAFLYHLEKKLSVVRKAQIASGKVPRFSLLLLDVDHFKKINDTHGHAAGDDVLKMLVAHAQSRSNWIIGRLGGDEFAILAEETDVSKIGSDVTSFMEDVTGALGSKSERRIYHGMSVGIAHAPDHSGLASELLTFADVALYEAKRNGRNQFAFFNPEMQSGQLERRRVARELREAILLNYLDVYYQPIVDRDAQVVGAEALVRWRHPVTLRIIPPDEFISVAEASTLIDDLGAWVFRRVCMDLDRLEFRRISINISGAQLFHDKLLPMLRDVLDITGQSPDRFVLEITETVAVEASDHVKTVMRELKNMGFCLALDDFGTGNSGFAVLRDLPFDVIKIDKSYIQRLEDDPISQAFVAGLGQLAIALDFAVVAEGIETSLHFELAKLRGINRFQGYYLGRPMSPAMIESVTENTRERRTMTAA